MSNVFKQASKAETALKNIDKRAEKARELLESRWAGKRSAYIEALPLQVRVALREAGVIEREDHSAELLSAAGVAFFASAENRAKFNVPDSAAE